MSKLNVSKGACIIFAFCAATAIATPAQAPTVAPTVTFTTLYSFCPDYPNCADGASPGGLVQGTDGNFYGPADSGGAHGRGTVFKITPGGKLTTLHSFSFAGYPSDGGGAGDLVQGTNGDFYGTTY